MKGISPLIATVLLVAFTVGVAGIISLWLTGFTKQQTETIGSQAEVSIVCSYGGINLRNLKFGNNLLNGTIENTGSIALGNISLQIIYTNASDQKIPLCLVDSRTVACSLANLSLSARELAAFSVSISSNYDRIRAYTNCSTVYDEVASNEVA